MALFEQATRTRTTPAGASNTTSVIGSTIGTCPVSTSAAATHIAFDPDMGGVSSGSMMMKPASAAGSFAGTSRFT